MLLFNQAPFAPLSGNVALDIAAYALAGMYIVRLGGDFLRHVQRIKARRQQTDEARLRLIDRAAVVSSLHGELIDARGQTESAVGAYLQDMDNRGRVSAAAQERERDPDFSDLEDQLARAATKSHTSFQR